jgi:anti-sigma-K factor RskA
MAPEREAETAAAELALGLLEGTERAAALRRVLAEPEFAREVERWREHFGVLFDQGPDELAPEGLLGRIEQSLEPKAPSAGYWRAVAAALTLVAASLILVIVLRPPSAPPSAPARPLVAILDPAERGPALPAIYDPARGELRIPAAATVSAGRTAELWLIGADGVPHSLGPLNASGRTIVQLPPGDQKKVTPGIKLAISSEPAGGSTTGSPTGPVLASGELIAS